MRYVNSQSSLKTSVPGGDTVRGSLHLACTPVPREQSLKWSVTPERLPAPLPHAPLPNSHTQEHKGQVPAGSGPLKPRCTPTAMAAHTSNPGTWEAEAGEEFGASLSED